MSRSLADLPKRRVDLYQEICRLQIQERPSARKLETLLNQCETQTVLEQVALTMMHKSAERLDASELLALMSEILVAQGETVSAQFFLDEVVQISELIVKQDDEYEFAHLSFQEYLAAVHIAAKPNKRERLLYAHLDDPW